MQSSLPNDPYFVNYKLVFKGVGSELIITFKKIVYRYTDDNGVDYEQVREVTQLSR